MAEHDSNDMPGYEQSDVPARIPFKVIVFMVLFVPIGLLVAWLLMSLVWTAIEEPPSPFTEDATEVPEPQLQTDPPRDYAAFQRDIEQRLSNVGWADAEAKVIHIPIEQAKQLLLERGLPEQTEPPSHSRIPLDPQAATRWLEKTPSDSRPEQQLAPEPAEQAEVNQ